MDILETVKGTGKTPMYAFLVGIFAAVIGIVTAFLLFPANVGIVSVFFISLALFPFWAKLLRRGMVLEGTEQTLIRGEKVHITELRLRSTRDRLNIVNLIRNHSESFQVYIFSFLGIFFVYVLLEMMVPVEMALQLFGEQTAILNPAASATAGTFAAIVINNLTVLFVCFLIALIYRSGIFIVAWNASVWGVIFGYSVRNSATLLGHEPFFLFVISILVIIPHLVLEALAYIFAAISGGIIFETIYKKLKSEQFSLYVTDAVTILLIGVAILMVAGIVETFFAIPWINTIFQR